MIVGHQELELEEEEFKIGDALAQMEELYQGIDMSVKITYHDLIERDAEDESQNDLLDRPYNSRNAEDYLFKDFMLFTSPVLRADRRKICDLIENFITLIQLTRKNCRRTEIMFGVCSATNQCKIRFKSSGEPGDHQLSNLLSMESEELLEKLDLNEPIYNIFASIYKLKQCLSFKVELADDQDGEVHIKFSAKIVEI